MFDFQFSCKCGKRSLRYNTTTEAAALEAVVSVEKWSVTNGITCNVCKPKKVVPLPTTASDHTGTKLSTIRLTLPVPPSANRYWRNFKGRMVVSSEATQYKKTVKALTAGITPLTGNVSLTIHWYRQRAHGDLGNREKVLSDSLQGIAFLDDAQISEIHLYRHDTDKKNPRCEVTVCQMVTVIEKPKPKSKRKAA